MNRVIFSLHIEEQLYLRGTPMRSFWKATDYKSSKRVGQVCPVLGSGSCTTE
ncbi:hypothetical protein CPB86DRAFT_791648 [Serendipita vermifera]|nr:hypothetical protein CPB86DRAFT_791648 [Serendipita vermifera]